MQSLGGFGNGADGSATLSGTDAPVDSSCSGTSGTTSLSATNASFAANKLIMIHQTRGTGAGSWELNAISAYVAGTITTQFALANTYTDSGASQAQVLQLKEYTDVTVSGTFTAKAWDGNVGGILAFLCSSAVTISGTVTASGKGYLGGPNTFSSNADGFQGEGTSGANTSRSTAANGTGGGGGQGDIDDGGSAGGGGHSTSGGNGAQNHFNSGIGGTGGGTGGSADLVTMLFGGGGGQGGCGQNGNDYGGAGGPGGGIILIMALQITVTGSIASNGDVGGEPLVDTTGGAGAGGAGGSIFLKTQIGVFGTNLVTATGGAGAGDNSAVDGGAGGTGRIRIESCSHTGTTNPSASESIGGHDFCAVFGSIY